MTVEFARSPSENADADWGRARAVKCAKGAALRMGARNMSRPATTAQKKVVAFSSKTGFLSQNGIYAWDVRLETGRAAMAREQVTLQWR